MAAPSGEREVLRVLTTTLARGYRLLVGGDDEQHRGAGRSARPAGLRPGDSPGVVRARRSWAATASARGMHRRIAAITGAAEAIIDGDLSAGCQRPRIRRRPRSAGRHLQPHARSHRRPDGEPAAGLQRHRPRPSHAADPAAPAGWRRAWPLRRGDRRRPPPSRARSRTSTPSSTLSPACCASPRSRAARGARRSGLRPGGPGTHRRRRLRPVGRGRRPVACTRGWRDRLVVEGDPRTAHPDAGQPGGKRAPPRRRTPGCACDARPQRRPTPSSRSPTTGRAFPTRERDRLFDRFHRLEASRSTPGSGLGLALVAAVARAARRGRRACRTPARPRRARRLPRPADRRNIGTFPMWRTRPVNCRAHNGLPIPAMRAPDPRTPTCRRRDRRLRRGRRGARRLRDYRAAPLPAGPRPLDERRQPSMTDVAGLGSRR